MRNDIQRLFVAGAKPEYNTPTVRIDIFNEDFKTTSVIQFPDIHSR